MTYIRCQSHVILGLVVTYHWNLLWFGSGVSGCVPLAIPPNQNYNSWGAPYVTPRAIAFNSHRENLLTIYLTFTLLDALFEFPSSSTDYVL